MLALRHLSLRHKIPLRVMALVIGTAVVVTTALIVREFEESRRVLQGHAASLGRVLAGTLITPLLHDDTWRAFEIVRSVGGDGAGGKLPEAVVVTNDQGRIVAASDPFRFPVDHALAAVGPAFDELAARLGARAPAGAPGADAPLTGQLGQDGYHFHVMPIIADGVSLGHVSLLYAADVLWPDYRSFVWRAAIVTAFVLLLLLPVSWYWAQRTADPLVALAAAMRRVPQSPELARVDRIVESGDEIGQLARAFRQMLEQLDEKTRLEQQIMVSERLAAIGRLSAGMAHEINNPLGGMLNAIWTWRRHHAPDPQTEKTLSLLERGLSQIQQTVSALLVETRVQDRPLRREDIDDVLLLVHAEMQPRHVRLELDCAMPEALPLPASLVRQILLNLLLNAVHAAADGGLVECRVRTGEDRLAIEVANDGRHIPEDRLQYLFEPFAMGGEEGHGLGLWMVYQIVHQLAGALTVDSRPGRTEFRIALPLGDASTEPLP